MNVLQTTVSKLFTAELEAIYFKKPQLQFVFSLKRNEIDRNDDHLIETLTERCFVDERLIGLHFVISDFSDHQIIVLDIDRDH